MGTFGHVWQLIALHIGQKCFKIRIVDFVQYLLSFGVARIEVENWYFI